VDFNPPSEWLLTHYIKKLDWQDKDVEVIEHHRGDTWNDGGSWYRTLLKVNTKFYSVYMPSDYVTDKLEVTEVEPYATIQYRPRYPTKKATLA